MFNSTKTTYTAQELADDYHDEMCADLNDLQGMNSGVAGFVFETLGQHFDRMQILTNFWDDMAEQLRAMADEARRGS